MRCADKISVQRGTTGKGFECSWLADLPGSSGKKRFALSIIAPNVVSRELLGSAKKELKKPNCRSSVVSSSSLYL